MQTLKVHEMLLQGQAVVWFISLFSVSISSTLASKLFGQCHQLHKQPFLSLILTRCFLLQSARSRPGPVCETKTPVPDGRPLVLHGDCSERGQRYCLGDCIQPLLYTLGVWNQLRLRGLQHGGLWIWNGREDHHRLRRGQSGPKENKVWREKQQAGGQV